MSSSTAASRIFQIQKEHPSWSFIDCQTEYNRQRMQEATDRAQANRKEIAMHNPCQCREGNHPCAGPTVCDNLQETVYKDNNLYVNGIAVTEAELNAALTNAMNGRTVNHPAQQKVMTASEVLRRQKELLEDDSQDLTISYMVGFEAGKDLMMASIAWLYDELPSTLRMADCKVPQILAIRKILKGRKI